VNSSEPLYICCVLSGSPAACHQPELCIKQVCQRPTFLHWPAALCVPGQSVLKARQGCVLGPIKRPLLKWLTGLVPCICLSGLAIQYTPTPLAGDRDWRMSHTVSQDGHYLLSNNHSSDYAASPYSRI